MRNGKCMRWKFSRGSFVAVIALVAAISSPMSLVAGDEASSSERGHHHLQPFVPMSRHLGDLYRQRHRKDFHSHRGHNNGYSRRFPTEYRTVSGDGNNRNNPNWGAAQIPFVRSMDADYHDGYLEPAGYRRPSARWISEKFCAQAEDESIPNERRATDFIWQWGQFLDHDLDETPLAEPAEAFAIEVPAGDPWFDPSGSGTQVIDMSRSAYISDEHGVRHQVNAITAFIDGSNVYGSDEERGRALRTLDGSGKLKTTDSIHGPLLPYNVDGFPNAGGPAPSQFLAGDVRANEQVGLTAMHTLFVREHNHWADKIQCMDAQLSGDDIYQMARVIVAAEIQAITFREFLPALLGRNALPRYRGYREDVNPGISNLFAGAAYRFGHSMLSNQLQRLAANGQSAAEGPLPLAQAFFNPSIIEDGGIDVLLRGLASQTAQRVDTRLINGVRNFLFGAPGAGGFDLAALNIQRGRDHGLPDYAAVRSAFGLSPIYNFEDIRAVEPDLIHEMQDIFETPGEIDAWTGFLVEEHVADALVGETLRAVLVDQFTRLRDGDRFYYQSYLHPGLRKVVEQQTLAVIIRRNTDIGRELQDDVFRINSRSQRSGKNKIRPSKRLPSFTGINSNLFRSASFRAFQALLAQHKFRRS